MKVKKLLAVLLALSAMLSIFSIAASAKNNTDRAYEFGFLNNQQMTDTEPVGYRKEDSSGTYLNYNGGTAQSAMYRVFGGANNRFETGTHINETKNGYAFVYRGQVGCISQYVYEHRYTNYGTSTPYAFLQASVNVVDGGNFSYASGLWSPDTLGSFPYFNR